MSPLFEPGCFVDFGPCGLQRAPVTPSCTLIHAATARKLRGELRLLCPRKPGVYGILDAHGELIYVGKAKMLRARLLSYFRPGRERRSARIINQARAIAWELCPSEFAALLRELELIRRWRPRLNVQGQPLRRRHAFVCLGRQPAPYVFLAARPPATALAVFGPVPAGVRTASAVARLNDLFKLRDCPEAHDMVFPEQGRLFPLPADAGCVRLEIGACLGPCTGTCPQQDYQKQVHAARAFLSGKNLAPLAELESAMRAAAAAENFERAAALRDRLASLQGLVDRLERLREARSKMSFIYPVATAVGATDWYLIHGGRPVQALPRPTDAPSALAAKQAITQLYGSPAPALLDSYEHVDGMTIVTSWFRKHPGELKKTLAPEKALRVCARLAP